MERLGDSGPAFGDPAVGGNDNSGFFRALGLLVAHFVKGGGTGLVGHGEDVLAGLAPALVGDADAPRLVLVGGAKLVKGGRRACKVVGGSHSV